MNFDLDLLPNLIKVDKDGNPIIPNNNNKEISNHGDNKENISH